MCPSLKCHTVFTRKLFSKTEKSIMLTPPKVPKVIVTNDSERQIFKAPRKREVLPRYVKKDLESSDKSTTRSASLFDSSDDNLASSYTKTPVPTKSKRMMSSLKNHPAFSRPIHSASDVWSSLSTPKSTVKKPSIRNKSQSVQGKTDNLKKKKTKSKTSNLSTQSSISTPYKSRSSAVEQSMGGGDCPMKRGSIEYNRSDSKGILLPEPSVDDVFGPDDDITSNVDELSEKLNALEVTDRCTHLDIPAEMRQKLIQDLEDLRGLVERICPYPLYVDICRLLAILKLLDLNKDKTKSKECITDSAYLLSETLASTLRQVFLGNAFYHKREKEDKGAFFTSLVKSSEFSTSQIEHLLNTIPSDYTVVQISLLPSEDIKLAPTAKLKTSKFIICRYQSGFLPQVMCLENSSMEKFTTSLLEEFENILKLNDIVVKNVVDDKNEWWKTRTTLNVQMKHLVKNIEDSWLGCWKGLLLSKAVSELRREKIEKIVNDLTSLSSAKIDEDLLRILVDSSPHLSREQLTSAICHLWSCSPLDDVHSRVFGIVRDASPSLEPTDRHPLVLLLDRHIQSLPWECLPILSAVPTSRMPSLAVLGAKCASRRDALDTQNAFYVLNPGGDLKYSEEFFRPKFEQLKKWKGIVGIPPNPEQCTAAFVDYDLFVYCGHGSGKQYLEGVCLDRVQCRASMVLMGCSSGVLKQQSRQVEAYGVPLMYLMNECPCFVGNLWDVTDRDIDRFTDKLFELFVPAYSSGQSTTSDIATTVTRARSACKMPYLVGAAPVIYGLPVYARS